MAAELEPGSWFVITLFDGNSAHVSNMGHYDRKTKGFVYHDTWGVKGFLEEDNNHAHVKAKPFAGPRGWFWVSESDLRKVLKSALIPYRFARYYFRTDDPDEALQEYQQLQNEDPDWIEVTEARLLKVGQLLAEAGEIARSINIYTVCSALHPGSARALAGLAEVNAKIGRTELATTFYTDAIKKTRRRQEPRRRPTQTTGRGLGVGPARAGKHI